MSARVHPPDPGVGRPGVYVHHLAGRDGVPSAPSPSAGDPAAAAIPFPARVRADLEDALSSSFGGVVRTLEAALLSWRVSPVWRVALRGPRGTPPSVIVKHLAHGWYGDPVADGVPHEFLEEAATYAFLEQRTDPPFLERARRVAWLPRGALVLEDLGSGDIELPLGRVGDLLAVAFARLHAATAGYGELHRAARRAMGIEVDGADLRYDGVDAAARRFARGAGVLAGWCDALAVAPAADVAGLLAAVQAAVLRPGPFHALVHDDLAAGRQCVVQGGRVLLLDWENAKYAHALRDLAKLLVGKFERRIDTGGMMRVCPAMDPALAMRYRRGLARAGGPDVDDATWGEEFCGAVLFNTVVQVGALVGLYGMTPVEGEVLPNLRGLVFRMGEVLHAQPGWEEPRRILLALAARIAHTRG